ncbi:MAG: hypothetical protein WCX12_01725 [Candidatus Paceibacterota bacterium]|jgi:hypothetical protein
MQNLIAELLKVSMSLLLAVQGNPQMPDKLVNQSLTSVSQAIQLSSQVLSYDERNHPVASKSIWPNFDQLLSASYLNRDGKRVALGDGVRLADSFLSFGDLNEDGLDDAVVVLKMDDGKGGIDYWLGAMLNKAGVLFNIVNKPIGKNVEIYSHHVESGQFTVDMKVDPSARKIYRFKLVGSEFREAIND